MIKVIDLYDYLLLPIYLAIFYYFVKRKAAGYDIELKKIFLTAFFLRMLGCIAYSLVLQYYYGGGGDSFTYYEGSDFLHQQLINNPANIKYFFTSSHEFERWFSTESDDTKITGFMAIASATTVMKISALFSFLAFNKFMIISLFFALFSFAGQWKLFLVFNDYNKGKSQTLLAYAVLYSPSIWFWGSGLLKDSICLGAVGFIISIFYNNVVKKQLRLGQWPLLLFYVFLVLTIKNYIILVVLASAAFVAFVRYVLQLKNILMRVVAITLFILSVFFILSVADFSSQINDLVQESLNQVKTFQSQYQMIQSQDETSKAGFDLGNVNESMTGLILKSPVAIFTCLFRPFLWESHKVIILFTSLESTILLLATLYLIFKTRFGGFFKIIFSNQFYLFSLILSLLFALIIGFTTFNFGTMIRYKIILLPFYYFMLVGIYTRIAENKTE